MLFVAFWSSWVLAAVEKCRQTFQAPISTGPGSSALFVANFTSAYVQDQIQFDVGHAPLGTEQLFAAISCIDCGAVDWNYFLAVFGRRPGVTNAVSLVALASCGSKWSIVPCNCHLSL